MRVLIRLTAVKVWGLYMAPPGPRDIGSEKSLHKMDKYFLLRAKRIKLSGLCNDEQDHFGNWHL